MKTTLNQIRECSPCTKGWTRLLKSLNKTTADDEPLPLRAILDSNGFEDAMWYLKTIKGEDRVIRLYAVWCLRQVQHLITDERCINAINAAEQYANGVISSEELEAAKRAAYAAACAAAYADDADDADIAYAAACAATYADDAAGIAYAAYDTYASAAAADAYAAGIAYDDYIAAKITAKSVQEVELRRVLDCMDSGIDPYPFVGK